jgi:hypothetical protein
VIVDRLVMGQEMQLLRQIVDRTGHALKPVLDVHAVAGHDVVELSER